MKWFARARAIAAWCWSRAGFYLSLAAVLTLIGGGAVALRTKPPAASPPAVVHSLDEPLAAVVQAEPTQPPLRLGWPVAGRETLAGYSITPTWSETLQLYQAHEGLDIATTLGEAVCASLDGTVTRAERDPLYGYMIELSHANGLVTRYGNLSTIRQVAVGDRVQSGQIIGAVGETALCESALPAHIHFEAWQGDNWMGESLSPDHEKEHESDERR